MSADFTTEGNESVQSRCPNMRRHVSGDLLVPCPDCYSVRITTEVLPEWQPQVPWRPATEARPSRVTLTDDEWARIERAHYTLAKHSNDAGSPLCDVIEEVLAARLAAIRELADHWEHHGGTESPAWQAMGPQVLTVPFAVKAIRDAAGVTA